MRIVKFLAMLTLASFTAASALATDEASVTGVLIYKRQQTVADTSKDPAATTLGQFFRDSPGAAPGRVPMVPTKEVAVLKIRKANGDKIEILQDWADSRKLTVGDKVLIEKIDGETRVVGVDGAAN
jgi:hypothetical protein